jgi:hypothetical protein
MPSRAAALPGEPSLRVPRWLAAVATAGLAGLTTLCLLEPAVAIVWQLGFANAARAELHGHHFLLIFVCLWLVYAADRWLDARKATSSTALSRRHAFFARHQRGIAGVWCLVFAAALLLAVRSLLPSDWLCSLGLLCLVTVYLGAVSSGSMRGLLKELAVAVIYPLGVLLFVGPRAAGSPYCLLLAQALFSWLVLCNLALIAARERTQDKALGSESLATRFCSAARLIQKSALLLGFCAAASAMLLPSAFSRLFWGVALAASGLLLLDRSAAKADANLVHALADVALLLPLPLWLW